jgi:PTH2 family peptidyl-tRNA hydrolase
MEENRSVKQVIIMRKDLKLRRGKEIAQGAHASIAWLTSRLVFLESPPKTCPTPICPHIESDPDCDGGLPEEADAVFSRAERQWLKSSFRKITLQVDSEEALIEVLMAAQDAGLEVNLITDAGLTEFHGVPTKTCIAIGPDFDELIDPVTADLKLY